MSRKLKTRATWQRHLRAVGACAEAVGWAQGYRTFGAAWNACPRGDWLLWWLAHTVAREQGSAGHRRLVLVACQCARVSLPHVRVGETRPLAAIDAAERWARGEEGVTAEQVRAAASAANAAAAAYAASAAADAAYTAAAAYAAADAAYTAAAASAASAAAVAAYAADARSARTRVLAQCADLVRAEFTATEVARARRARKEPQ